MDVMLPDTSALRRFLIALRQWGDGVTRVTYGCCSGDPMAFQRDAEQRFKEQEAARNTHVAHTRADATSDDPHSRRAAVP
jgi:hypothetical protein